MDLINGVEKRFSSVAARRISHGSTRKSKVRRGEHESPMDRLLKRIEDARKNSTVAQKSLEKKNA